MTSLQLFPPVDPKPLTPIEWGTGKLGGSLKPKENIWTPKAPTWQYQGKPIDQYYTLTKLKLSNVRWNDQLVTKPQELDMGKVMIDKPFPAEHTHSSHTSRAAVFPTFAESPEDPKRGVDARNKMPKNAEMPSQPYDCTIISKTKGTGLRHEIQQLPPESLKQPLVWQGDDNFFQKPKNPDADRQVYYPSPPKTLVPNLEKRRPEMQVTPKTANALRNVEREQWQTTYDLNHTGIGPINPLKLDNYGDKLEKYNVTGDIDDKLYPSSINTYDPPRPVEGRLARGFTPDAQQQNTFSKYEGNPDYIRKMTLSELEEHRLLNGKDYLNFPSKEGIHNKHMGQEWMRTQEESHPDHGLGTLRLTQAADAPPRIPHKEAGAPPATMEGSYLAPLRQDQHDKHQQIEAGNRWKVLELQTPQRDLQAMQHKLGKVSSKTEPKVFYNHEGEYTEERAGLYKTSYNPNVLAASLNDKQNSTASKMQTSQSHRDALSHPTYLNGEMAGIWQESETMKTDLPNLQDGTNPRDIMAPYEMVRDIQTNMIQPTVATAGVRTQEGGVVLKESTMGDSYNTHKFLQENNLQPLSRNEPFNLMSLQNQKLHPNVRSAANSNLSPPGTNSRSVKFNESIEVADGAGGEPIRLSTANISNPKQTIPVGFSPGYSQSQTQPITQTQPNKLINENIYQHREDPYKLAKLSPLEDTRLSSSEPIPEYTSSNVPLKSQSCISPLAPLAPMAPTVLPVASSPLRKARPQTSTDIFASNSTNVAPTGLNKGWEYKTAYMNQFNPEEYQNLNFKNDDFFDYKCDTGFPRQQSDLIKIQENFSKTKAHQQFHNAFPETNPDLRENITTGYKHQFYPGSEMNAQVLHDSTPNYHLF